MISKIKKHQHLFAMASPDAVDLDIQPFSERLNKYGFEYMAPGNIIGTSAHHAGVLFLENAILSEFWNGEESELDLSNHFQIPCTNFGLLETRIDRERLLVFNPDLESIPRGNNSIPFDDFGNTFCTKEGVSVTFSGGVQYHLFKYIFENRRASYEELSSSIPKWKKDRATRGAIDQAKIRVNTDLSKAELLASYERCTKNKHICFRSDAEKETTN